MWVSNEPLRLAFERSGLSTSDLARYLGYARKRGDRDGWDGAPIKRALGLKAAKMRATHPSWQPQTMVREATALRYAEALGLDPVDLGL